MCQIGRSHYGVHSAAFPDGEVRGQVQFVRAIPESTMLLLLAWPAWR